MKYIVLILLLMVVAEISFAEVYKWVDDKGNIHFTDDSLQIPEKYRPSSEKMGLTESKTGTQLEGDSTVKNKKDTSYREQFGRDEDYWKGRVEEWRKRLKALQERVENLRIKYNEITEKFNDSKNKVERVTLRQERDQIKNEMDQDKIQIEEAKNMLEKKIPEEAELYKAKPEWIK
jgi:hypothetical protein